MNQYLINELAHARLAERREQAREAALVRIARERRRNDATIRVRRIFIHYAGLYDEQAAVRRQC